MMGPARSRARAGTEPKRAVGNPQLPQLIRELRATGAGDPRQNANPRSTRARQAPPQRADVDVPSRRPTTLSGREGVGLEAGVKEEWGGVKGVAY